MINNIEDLNKQKKFKKQHNAFLRGLEAYQEHAADFRLSNLKNQRGSKISNNPGGILIQNYETTKNSEGDPNQSINETTLQIDQIFDKQDKQIITGQYNSCQNDVGELDSNRILVKDSAQYLQTSNLNDSTLEVF